MFTNITHLLCGADFDDKDIGEATDIYDIPAVTGEWVKASVRLGRLACTKVYHPMSNDLFAPIVAAIADLTPNDRKKLYALITFHGGRCERNFTAKTTHLVCGSTNGNVYKSAVDIKSDKFSIITPDWFAECLKAQEIIDTVPYHPRLLTSVGKNNVSDGRSLASIIGSDDPRFEVKKTEPAKYSTLTAQVKAQFAAKTIPNSTINATSSISTVTTSMASVTTAVVNQKPAEPIHTKPMDSQRNLPNQLMNNLAKPTEQAIKEKIVCATTDFCYLDFELNFYFWYFTGTTEYAGDDSGIKDANDTHESSAYTIFAKAARATA